MGARMSPVRVQRKRTKGWRMPENTLYVGRGSKWGNPNKIGDHSPIDGEPMEDYEVVSEYRANLIFGRDDIAMPTEEDITAELAGKNLACWCPLDQPCHADVLLELANP